MKTPSEKMRDYRQSGTDKAKAYVARHKEKRKELSKSWNKRNHDRKLLIGRLNYYVGSGQVVKPELCADCDQKVVPLVVAGLRDSGGPVPAFDAWVCWKCHSARRKLA